MRGLRKIGTPARPNIPNPRSVTARSRRQTSSDVGVSGLTDYGVGAGHLLSRSHRILDGFLAGGAYGSSHQHTWVSLLDRSFNRVGTHERRRECPADLTPRPLSTLRAVLVGIGRGTSSILYWDGAICRADRRTADSSAT